MRMEENSKRRTRRSTGRKPKTDPAVFRYGIKLTSEENGNFELLFEKSGMKQRARFIKAMIFGREMKVVRIDKAAMDYYIRLTNFYHQFQAIGNNYNQTVKAVKSNFGEKRAFALLRNLEKATIDLVVLKKEGGTAEWWLKSTGVYRSTGRSSTTSVKWTRQPPVSSRATA